MNVIRKSLLILSVGALCCCPAFGADQERTVVRIGTYDSRAIAIAYAPSKYNPVRQKMKAFEQAKTAGDEKQMKELEGWGQKHQRQLHRQGFSFVPVNDLLQHVAERLPEVAKTANVVSIVRACDYVDDSVQVVDITDQLVKLFDPSEKTLNNIRLIREKPPVDLDEVEQHHEH